jgi:hypothetical protein
MELAMSLAMNVIFVMVRATIVIVAILFYAQARGKLAMMVIG